MNCDLNVLKHASLANWHRYPLDRVVAGTLEDEEQFSTSILTVELRCHLQADERHDRGLGITSTADSSDSV
jgi:hypothetical protein